MPSPSPTLRTGGLVVLAATLTSGCLNSTLQSVSIPQDVTWSQVAIGLASPYGDLQVLPSGDGVNAVISPPMGDAQAYCGNPVDGTHLLVNPMEGCPEGFTDYGLRYTYQLTVSLNRAVFAAGGVAVTSALAGGTVNAMSLAINSTAEMKIVAALSEGTIPLPWPSGRPVTEADQGYMTDNYAGLAFAPHDWNFMDAQHGDPARPDVLCQFDGENDILFFNTATATAGAYDCGIPIALDLTVAPPPPPEPEPEDPVDPPEPPPVYASLGQCISQSMLQNCKNEGLKGRARSACNHAQTAVCKALFHKPGRRAR